MAYLLVKPNGEFENEGEEKDLSLKSKNKIKKWVMQNHILRELYYRDRLIKILNQE